MLSGNDGLERLGVDEVEEALALRVGAVDRQVEEEALERPWVRQVLVPLSAGEGLPCLAELDQEAQLQVAPGQVEGPRVDEAVVEGTV